MRLGRPPSPRRHRGWHSAGYQTRYAPDKRPRARQWPPQQKRNFPDQDSSFGEYAPRAIRFPPLQLIGSFTSAIVKTFASKRCFDSHLDKLVHYARTVAIVGWWALMSWLGSLGRLGVIMVPL